MGAGWGISTELACYFARATPTFHSAALGSRRKYAAVIGSTALHAGPPASFTFGLFQKQATQVLESSRHACSDLGRMFPAKEHRSTIDDHAAQLRTRKHDVACHARTFGQPLRHAHKKQMAALRAN